MSGNSGTRGDVRPAGSRSHHLHLACGPQVTSSPGFQRPHQYILPWSAQWKTRGALKARRERIPETAPLCCLDGKRANTPAFQRLRQPGSNPYYISVNTRKSNAAETATYLSEVRPTCHLAGIRRASLTVLLRPINDSFRGTGKLRKKTAITGHLRYNVCVVDRSLERYSSPSPKYPSVAFPCVIALHCCPQLREPLRLPGVANEGTFDVAIGLWHHHSDGYWIPC
ncbi:hypothetical protein VUR80DRAFT_7535 [Thermomyces stellatus]